MPEDILLNMIPFLNVRDRQCLRQVCAHINAETRKKVGYLRLNKKHSEKYLSNGLFREAVMMSVANTKKQVSLRFEAILRGRIMNGERRTAFATVHALDYDNALFEIKEGKRKHGMCYPTEFDLDNDHYLHRHRIGISNYICSVSIVSITADRKYIIFYEYI
jgi:hypothetical protein